MSMRPLTVEIDSAPTTKSGTDRNTQRPYSYLLQKGWFDLGGKHPCEYEFRVPDDVPGGYQPGVYVPAGGAFKVSDSAATSSSGSGYVRKRFELGTLYLVTLEAAAKALMETLKASSAHPAPRAVA